MKINRRTALKLAGGALAASAVGVPFFMRKRLDAPNLLFVLADDMRYDAMGCAGNSIIKTPAMDALAASGCYFSNHFVTTSICPVSRASIMTSQHVRRHGVKDFGTPLPREALRASFPAVMKRAGYYTGFIGKWGIGGPFPQDVFDRFEGFAGQGEYKQGGVGAHLTDTQTDQCIEFLKSRPKDQPFMLMVSTKAPHGPFVPQERMKPLYADVTVPRARTDTPEDAAAAKKIFESSMPWTNFDAFRTDDAAYEKLVKNYYRLITGVDGLLASALHQLEEQGLLDSTAVIFSSDNGLMLGEHGMKGKWCMYEESIRVPLMIRTAPHYMPLAPARLEAMSLNIDIAPTMLALAGLQAPDGMQGLSLLPAMQGKADTRDAFYYDHPYTHGGVIWPCEGVRTKEWKYTRYRVHDKRKEVLFNLKDDPLERHDLAADPDAAERLQRLRGRCDRLRERVG